MDLFRSSSLSWFQSPFVRIPAVQFRSVTQHKSAMVGSSRNLQASAELARVSRSGQDQPECQEFSAVPLLSWWSEEQWRWETNKELHSQLCKGPVTVCWVPLILSPNITCSSMSPASSEHHVSLPQQTAMWVCIIWHPKLSLQPGSKCKGMQ